MNRTRFKFSYIFLPLICLLSAFFAGFVTSYQSKSESVYALGTPSTYCLRDDYVYYTQDQSLNGICWTFATSTAMSTTLMKATDQYYDFSEEWIAIAYSYEHNQLPNGGGNFNFANNTLKKYGAVLESDCLYENSFIVDLDHISNYFDYYLQFANTEVMEQLQDVSYTNIADMKQHIYDHGALYVDFEMLPNLNSTAYNGRTIYYKEADVKTHYYPSYYSGHAVSIIGWDDTISFTAQHGSSTQEFTGAWIALNSWGEGDDSQSRDGTFYLFYDDTDYDRMYGYKYIPSTTGIYFYDALETGYDYTTNLVGKYYGNFATSSATTKQKNLFYTDDVSLTYSYDISAGTNIKDISIYYGAEELSRFFDISQDKTNKRISLRCDNLSTGPYKIITTYTNGADTEKKLDVFYVLDGTEMSSIVTICQNVGVTSNGYFKSINTYNYANKDLEFFVTQVTSNSALGLKFVPSVYSRITSINVGGKIFTANIADSFNALPTRKTSVPVTITSYYGVNSYSIRISYDIDTTNQVVNLLYSLDGGNNSNNTQKSFSKGSITLKKPTKEGYNFLGWYYNKSCTLALSKSGDDYSFSHANIISLGTNPQTYFRQRNTTDINNLQIYSNYFNNANVAFVYAKWEFAGIKSVTLSTTAETKFAYQDFNLTIDLDHGLKDFADLTVELFKNGSLVDTLTGLNIVRSEDAGSYTYYAVITLRYKGNVVTKTTNSLSVNVIINLSGVRNITLNGTTYSWESDGGGINEKFVVRVLKGDSLVKTENVSTNSFNIASNVNVTGTYKIAVQRTLKEGLVTSYSDFVESAEITLCAVKFYTRLSGEIVTNIVLPNATVSALALVEPTGYTFIGWYDDTECTSIHDFSLAVTGETNIYAKWELAPISLNSISGTTKTYDTSNYNININPSHVSGQDSYTYVWKKNNTNTYDGAVAFANTKVLSVKNVLDSGFYFIEVTLTDEDGNSVTNASNIVEIRINKADTTIDVSEVNKNYVYNGQTQTISGMTTNRDEEVYYEFVNGSFKNVPASKKLQVTITAPETDNYNSSSVSFEINIDKALPSYTLGEQTYQYSKIGVVPNIIFNNDEESAEFNATYSSLGLHSATIVVEETDNYYGTTIPVDITIVPQKVKLKLKNNWSLWPFNVRKVEYSVIEGDIYDDDLGLTLDFNAARKPGKYEVNYTWTNENYDIEVENPVYSVIVWPYIIGGATILIATIAIIAAVKKSRRNYY